MPKPNKQTQIDFIVDCLRKGEQRKTILAKFGKKWQSASPRTFDRRLKAAEINLQGEQQRIKGEAEQDIIKAIEARKSKIMTSFERQEFLQKQINDIQDEIDRGVLEEYVVVAGKLQLVNKIMNAETKAYLRKTMKELLAELNKMDGSYTPIKTDITSGGKPINTGDLSKLSVEDLIALRRMKEKVDE